MSDETIRRAALMILDGRVNEGQSELIGAAYDLIKQGVSIARRQALRASGGETETDMDPVEAFLRVKLLGCRLGEDDKTADLKICNERRDKFLRSLLEARDCAAFIRVAARNLATEAYRKRPIRTVPMRSDAPEAGDDDDAVELIEESLPQLEAPSQWLSGLDPWQSIVLKVTYVPDHLSPAEIGEIASRRGVGAPEVARDLEARSARTTEGAFASALDLEKRRILWNTRRDSEQRLIRWESDAFSPHERVASRVTDIDPAAPTVLDSEALRPLLTSRTLFERTDEATRLRVFLYAANLVRAAYRSLDAARLACMDGPRPDFREVAMILGELSAEATAEEAETAANTVGRRVKRLLKSLKAQGAP